MVRSGGSKRLFQRRLDLKMSYILFLVFAISLSQSAVAELDPFDAQEPQPYMTPSEVACYECDSEADGAMCYDPSMITKQSRMCGLNATRGGACAVIRVESSQELLTNPQPRSIQRKCMERCTPGCTSFGSGNEMLECTSCCTTTFCNLSNTSPLSAGVEPLVIAVMVSIVSLWRLKEA